MAKSRISILAAILKGLLAAIALTLVCMVIFAALVVFLHISDTLLTVLNQILKVAAIFLGVRFAVGRGGERGFLTGMTIAMLYMVLGYVLYVFLGGSAFSVPAMLGEILIGAAIGSLTGAILANLPAKSGRRRTRTA